MNSLVSQARYDVIISGARCAGASTAMLLARAGLDVLVVERGRRGTDALSTHALMRSGVLQLHRWGLLPRIERAGVPKVERTTFYYEGNPVEVPIQPRYGVQALYAPKRALLDQTLADAASADGAELHYRTSLVELLRRGDGRVCGARLRDDRGVTTEVEAAWVIGADGLRSRVAEQVDATIYRQTQHMGAVLIREFQGLNESGYHWHYGQGATSGIIPLTADRVCVFVGVPSSHFRQTLGTAPEAAFWHVLERLAPDFVPRLRGAVPVDRLRGFGGHPGYFRQSHGPGWALVGDAGYFKDPATAHGISDALRDAELLSRALVTGKDAALADYQQQRDALSAELLRLTDAIASFKWDMRQLADLHRSLSQEMSRENQAIAAWDCNS